MWSCGCIVAELLSMEEASVPCYLDRQPLFPGVSSDMTPGGGGGVDADSADQLESIVRVVGTPDSADVEALAGDDASAAAAKARLGALASRESADLADIFPGAEAPALDLLKRLLTLDPKKRFDVRACLDHAYVACGRPASRGPRSARGDPPPLPRSIKSSTDADELDLRGVKIDLDFDDAAQPPMRVAQLRDLIREHTRAFRSDEGAREAAADAPPAPKRQKT